jgi:pimeloyl-ACP methyl ester carboxylesterase
LTTNVDRHRVLDAARSDTELAYKLRSFTGVVRLVVPGGPFELSFVDGVATSVTADSEIEASVTWDAPAQCWEGVLSPTPLAGYESLTMVARHGFKVSGDFVSVIAPWQGGWSRLFAILRASVAGPSQRRPFTDPFRSTDDAVGRYVYVRAEGVEARVYYETAGHGPVPLLLQATAGADSRQYRHLLADPRMQQRFTMYAYDLPYHGRSLPPLGVRWWEQPYTPTKASLMEWVVAIKDAIGLGRPFFMGCSVGGQLALDLAAEHSSDFSAFVSVNGWYGAPQLPPGFSNDLYRTPEVSSDYAPQLNFGATAPVAPEPYAHETYWVYRSAFPGIYAGDNDYFCHYHDLAENGHLIDAHATPVYVVTGEWDPASDDVEIGGPAVARKIPGAKFVKLSGLGHFAPCDDPIGFGDAIIPVLDEVLERVHTSTEGTVAR